MAPTRRELEVAENRRKKIQLKKFVCLQRKNMALNLKNYSLQNANAELIHTVQNLKTQLKEAENKVLSSTSELFKAMEEKNVFQESLKNLSSLLPDLISIWNGTNLFASKYISAVTSSLRSSRMPTVPSNNQSQPSCHELGGQISNMIHNLEELMGNSMPSRQTNETLSTATSRIPNLSNSVVPEQHPQSVDNNLGQLNRSLSALRSSPTDTVFFDQDINLPPTNYRAMSLNPLLSPVQENTSQSTTEDGVSDSNSYEQIDCDIQKQELIIPKTEEEYDVQSVISDSTIDSVPTENGEKSSNENILSSNENIRKQSQESSWAIVGNDPGSYRSSSSQPSLVTCPSLAVYDETALLTGKSKLNIFSNVFPRRKKGKFPSEDDIEYSLDMQKASVGDTLNRTGNHSGLPEASIPVIEVSDNESRMGFFESTNPLNIALANSTPTCSGNNRYLTARSSSDGSTLKNSVTRDVLVCPKPEETRSEQHSSKGSLDSQNSTLKISSVCGGTDTSSFIGTPSSRNVEQKKGARSGSISARKKCRLRRSRSSPRIQAMDDIEKKRRRQPVSYKEPSINSKMRRDK